MEKSNLKVDYRNDDVNKVYNSKRKIIIDCGIMTLSVIFLVLDLFFVFNIKYLLVLVFIGMCIILLTCRYFKILVSGEKIEFYSIFRTKKTFYWKDIKKLEVEKLNIRYLIDYRINLTLYTDNAQCTFDVRKFDNKEGLFKDIINKCACYGINIDHRIIG